MYPVRSFQNTATTTLTRCWLESMTMFRLLVQAYRPVLWTVAGWLAVVALLLELVLMLVRHVV